MQTSCRDAVGEVQQGILPHTVLSPFQNIFIPVSPNTGHLLCYTLLLYKLSSWPLHVCMLCRLHPDYVDSKYWKSGGSRGLIAR